MVTVWINEETEKKIADKLAEEKAALEAKITAKLQAKEAKLRQKEEAKAERKAQRSNLSAEQQAQIESVKGQLQAAKDEVARLRAELKELKPSRKRRTKEEVEQELESATAACLKVLTKAKEPMSARELVAKTKLAPELVKVALVSLLNSEEVQKEGLAKGTKYSV